MQWKRVKARAFGDILIIDLRGSICTCGEEELPAFVADLLERGFIKFVLNLREVPFIDSCGLGGLVRAYTTVTGRSGKLVLLHVHMRIRETFRYTKLDSVLETFDTEEEALSAFRGLAVTAN